MKKLKLTCLLLCLLLAVSVLFTGCSDTADPTPATVNTEAPATGDQPGEPGDPTEPAGEPVLLPSSPDGSKGLLWEVTSDSGGKLYMLGSIHVGTEDIVPFHDVLAEAFHGSGALAVEADIFALMNDMERMMALQAYATYADGSTVEAHISPETYARLRDYFEQLDLGVPFEMLEYFTASELANTIMILNLMEHGITAEYGTEMLLLANAHENNIPVIEIESLEFQMELLASFPARTHEFLLLDALKEAESGDGAEITAEWLRLWKAGDSAGFDASYFGLIEEGLAEYSEDDARLFEDYLYKLLDERNFGMFDKARELLAAEQTVFYVVGAAHMFGENGLVTLLENAGYAVRAMW
jgi:hypothetical protein